MLGREVQTGFHSTKSTLSPYMLFGSQVYKDNELFYYMDGYDTSKSNWMRYVNPAYSSASQNLIACQYKVHAMILSVRIM
jgi:hypothetical protein